MVELNSDLLRRIQDRVDQVCSLDKQTLQALLRTADRLVRPGREIHTLTVKSVAIIKWGITVNLRKLGD